MKSLIRVYFTQLFGLWLMTFIFKSSFTIGNSLLNFLVAALILTALNLLLKPILKVLFFPVNVITLGLFSLIINALTFYIFILLSPQVHITSWLFPGFSFQDFHLKSYQLNFIETLLAVSISLSLVTNILIFIIN